MKTTQQDKLKTRILETLSELLQAHKEDIETGIEEGIYKKKDNVKRLAWIEAAEKDVQAYTLYTPNIYACVEGGILQGASADCKVNLEVYDVDNLKNGDEADRAAYIQSHGTPEAWDEMIRSRTIKDEIIAVY